mmetsp:Transcript_50572/g.57284  ORF Transcript_50572/g.57284 Transcript_50572/m.57284 type:complete len:207 (-) Transcript_50572:87-707(-)
MSSSSWIQVYVTGFPLKAIIPSDEHIEQLLEKKYNLSSSNVHWAGPGTTTIKRDKNHDERRAFCRGFGFLTFYSLEGAKIIIDRINDNYGNNNNGTDNSSSRRSNNNDNDDGNNDNDNDNDDEDDNNNKDSLPCIQFHLLRAELGSNDKKKKKKTNNEGHDQREGRGQGGGLPDLRLRSKRGASMKKHPVITNSDGSKTNIGNKTR